MVIITPHVWVVRRGEHAGSYGDPYENAAVITRFGDTAFVEAWTGPANTEDARFLIEFLRKEGIKRVAWERRRGDKTRHVVFRLDKH